MNRPVLLQFDSPPPLPIFPPVYKVKDTRPGPSTSEARLSGGPDQPLCSPASCLLEPGLQPAVFGPSPVWQSAATQGPCLGAAVLSAPFLPPPPPKPANGCPSACSPAVLLLFEFSKASPNSPPAGATRSCASWAPLGESPPQLAGWPEAWEYLGLEI